MKILKMKVASFTPASGDLVIHFASDTAERPIDDYPAYPLQVITDGDMPISDVLRAVAATGWGIAEQQEAAEQAARDNDKVAEYMELVGKEFSFDPAELFPPPPPTCAAANQPSTDGLIEL